MTKLFVPYKLAVMLKEKGFDDSCFAHYRDLDPNSLIMLSTGIAGVRYSWLEDKDIVLAPTYQDVIDWFFDKGIYIVMHPDALTWGWHYNGESHYYETKKDAIIEALELIK